MSALAGRRLKWWHHLLPPRWHRIEQRHERELALLHEQEWGKMARAQSQRLEKKAHRLTHTMVFQGGSAGTVITTTGAGGAGGDVGVGRIDWPGIDRAGRLVERKTVEIHR